MNLVYHDELAALRAQVGVCIVEAPPVRGPLEIEVERGRQLPGKRRFADLPGHGMPAPRLTPPTFSRFGTSAATVRPRPSHPDARSAARFGTRVPGEA